jgi:hypothetical protein
MKVPMGIGAVSGLLGRGSGDAPVSIRLQALINCIRYLFMIDVVGGRSILAGM